MTEAGDKAWRQDAQSGIADCSVTDAGLVQMPWAKRLRQRDGSVGKDMCGQAWEPECDPGAHRVGEDWLLQAVLWSSHMCT